MNKVKICRVFIMVTLLGMAVSLSSCGLFFAVNHSLGDKPKTTESP